MSRRGSREGRRFLVLNSVAAPRELPFVLVLVVEVEVGDGLGEVVGLEEDAGVGPHVERVEVDPVCELPSVLLEGGARGEVSAGLEEGAGVEVPFGLESGAGPRCRVEELRLLT